MLYAVLCYHAEAAVSAMTGREDEAMMAGIADVKDKLAGEGKLAAAVRLMPTTAATTVREGREMLVLDGPFAETKEQLLGFYVIDCASLEEAIEATRRLAEPRIAAGLTGALEIRPIAASSILRTT
jgi:hypothetical protein